MRKIWAFAGRELGGGFHSTIGSGVGTVFLLVAGFFFRTHVLFFHFQSFQAGVRPPGAEPLRISDGIIRPFLGSLGFLVLLVLPFLTMRLFSEERRSGSLELLLSYPVRPFEAVLGKFLGALLFYAILLLASLALPAFLFFVSEPDLGALLCGYAGLLLLGASFLSLGLLASSLTSSPAVAASGAFGFFLVAWAVGWTASVSGPRAAEALEAVSFLHRYARFGAGIVDAGDALFFIAWIVYPLVLAARVVGSGRRRA
ncbi:MAG: ABC transporter permease subunit [Candidatus Eisenbacteria bacterium]